MKKVCLSFDFEECDLPRESGVDFPIEEGMRVSSEGAHAVLDVLEKHGVGEPDTENAGVGVCFVHMAVMIPGGKDLPQC